MLILHKYRSFFSTPFTERFWRLFRARLLLRSVFFFEFLFLLFFYIYVILYNISLPNRIPQALLSTKKLKQSVLFFSSSTSVGFTKPHLHILWLFWQNKSPQLFWMRAFFILSHHRKKPRTISSSASFSVKPRVISLIDCSPAIFPMAAS